MRFQAFSSQRCGQRTRLIAQFHKQLHHPALPPPLYPTAIPRLSLLPPSRRSSRLPSRWVHPSARRGYRQHLPDRQTDRRKLGRWTLDDAATACGSASRCGCWGGSGSEEVESWMLWDDGSVSRCEQFNAERPWSVAGGTFGRRKATI